MRVLWGSMLAAAAAALGACAHERDEAAMARSRSDAVVYGTDDRKDVYEHSDLRMRTIANLASVVLAWPPYIDESDPANVRPSDQTKTLGEYKNLCATEPFRSDPAMGSCSGALIDDDLVLTAGHCVPTLQDCIDARIVFNWQRTSATALHPMTKDDVFRCTARLVFKYETSADGAMHDYAILKLDRSAVPRFRPTAVRHDATTKVSLGAGIGIIGYGNGIPAKIDTGATVLHPGGSKNDFFVHTSDAYSGNSGSPVFDLTSYEIAGILVRGTADDFVETPSSTSSAGTCFVNQACPANGDTANGCTGMSSDYASKSVTELCATKAHATRYPLLCATSPCGNGRCEASETTTSCPSDCTIDAGSDATSTEPKNNAPSEDSTPSPSSKAPLREARPATMSSGCSASTPNFTAGGETIFTAAVLLTLRRRRRRRSR